MLRVRYADKEYTIPKALLRGESSYFPAMFNGPFAEEQEQAASLAHIEGIVSPSSVEGLIQWPYHREIHFPTVGRQEEISAAIELARFAYTPDNVRQLLAVPFRSSAHPLAAFAHWVELSTPLSRSVIIP